MYKYSPWIPAHSLWYLWCTEKQWNTFLLELSRVPSQYRPIVTSYSYFRHLLKKLLILSLDKALVSLLNSLYNVDINNQK
jgi:hypothetical protein